MIDFDSAYNELCEDPRVGEFVRRVLMSNPAAYGPYHNNQHCVGVAKIALYILDTERVEYLRSAKRQLSTELLCASLLHDYDHTLGKETDAVNIKRALKGLDGLTYYLPLGVSEFSVSDAIECTTYPFSIEPKRFIERCLRDADILYLSIMCEKSIVDGLRQEMEVSMKRSITMEEMILMQKQFYSTARFYTNTGAILSLEAFPQALEKMKGYI